MGVGVYWQENAFTVFVDDEELYAEYSIEKQQHENIEHDDDYQSLHEDFVQEVLELLPESYEVLTDTWEGGYSFGDVSRQILAENGFYRVSLVDWHGMQAINVELRQAHYSDSWEFNPLAVHHHGRAATKIFDALAERFALRGRTSGWTTGCYVKSTEKLAA